MAKIEVSNLLEYSPNQIELLLRGIKLVEQEEVSSIAARKDMLNGEDMSVPFVRRQYAAIKVHNANLEDLLSCKIALQTILDNIIKKERILNQ